MSFQIHHIALNVFDAEKSANFYIKVFSFVRIERQKTNEKHKSGAWLQMGAAQLHLQERKKIVQKTDQHFAIEVKNIMELRNMAMSEGGKFEEGKPLPGYSKRGFLYDLDENRIELLEK